MEYRGLVIDRMQTLETRKTKVYGTYKEAHEAAEKLCKKTLGERGEINIKIFASPFITKSMQEAYEQGTKGSQDKTPEICGYYGRACRQMNKPEGANRMPCQSCGLAKYCTPAEWNYSH